MRLTSALIAFALLVALPVLGLDRLLALAGTGVATRDAVVVLAAVGAALGATLYCPPSPAARLVLGAAALAIALEPLGDGLVIPVATSALCLVVVWLARPTAVPATHR